ncbi:MAG: OmpA family protein [bacterium]|jgi:outer membrane protein OmpA-like peptidoglycan-associated protein|nr:OmpA family protein [bacterium]
MKVISLLFLITCSLYVTAQEADTLIYAQGKITNGVTKEPVAARISYQSLPYGSKVGFLSGSSFSFPLFDNEKYSITVEAAGFAPSKYQLDPADANSERRVIQDIELSMPSGAANNAETTHTIGKVMRLDDLNFDAGKVKIASTSFGELDEVVLMLKNNPRMVIQLEGHTDTRGNANANLKLSQERVDAVKAHLASKGSNKKQIKTKAFGGTSPFSLEDTEEAHALNRRVELRVLQN